MKMASSSNWVTDERGSIAPLGLGLFLFSLIFSFTTVSATSIFIFQKRLSNVAESAALFVASEKGESADFLKSVGSLDLDGLWVTNWLEVDLLTTTVKACANWRAPIVTVGDFSRLQICSTGSARSGF